MLVNIKHLNYISAQTVQKKCFLCHISVRYQFLQSLCLNNGNECTVVKA